MHLLDLEPASVDVGSDDEDDVCHLICPVCYPDNDGPMLAMCGVDVTDDPWDDGTSSRDCELCAYLRWFPCGACGTVA